MSDDINAVLTFDPFAGSLATREHAWRGERLLGSFACEKISPRWNNSYIPHLGKIWRVGVWFLGQVQATFVLEFQKLSFQAFEGYFQWISKAGIFNFSQPPSKDPNGFQWIFWTLLDSLVFYGPSTVPLNGLPLDCIFNGFPQHTIVQCLCSTFHLFCNLQCLQKIDQQIWKI